jgi:hypothetical protein
MPDRAIVPLVCGGSAGFLCGLIASVLEMSGGAAVVLALVAGAFAALAGAASTSATARRCAYAAGGCFAYCLTQIRVRTQVH